MDEVLLLKQTDIIRPPRKKSCLWGLQTTKAHPQSDQRLYHSLIGKYHI